MWLALILTILQPGFDGGRIESTASGDVLHETLRVITRLPLEIPERFE